MGDPGALGMVCGTEHSWAAPVLPAVYLRASGELGAKTSVCGPKDSRSAPHVRIPIDASPRGRWHLQVPCDVKCKI